MRGGRGGPLNTLNTLKESGWGGGLDGAAAKQQTVGAEPSPRRL